MDKNIKFSIKTHLTKYFAFNSHENLLLHCNHHSTVETSSQMRGNLH